MKEWLKKIWSYLKTTYQFGKDVFKITLWVGISLIPFVLITLVNSQYSSFGETIVKMAIPIAGWFLFDKYCLPEIDTLTKIKEDNNVLASVILAVAIIFAAAAISS